MWDELIKRYGEINELYDEGNTLLVSLRQSGELLPGNNEFILVVDKQTLDTVDTLYLYNESTWDRLNKAIPIVEADE